MFLPDAGALSVRFNINLSCGTVVQTYAVVRDDVLTPRIGRLRANFEVAAEHASPLHNARGFRMHRGDGRFTSPFV